MGLPWHFRGFPGGASGQEPTGDIKDADSIPGQEDPLEEGMGTHSSILAWRTPWTEEPVELWFTGLQRIRQD